MMSEESLIEAAADALAAVLPPNWQVERNRGRAEAEGISDAQFYVKAPSSGGQLFLVEALLNTSPVTLEGKFLDPYGRRMRVPTSTPTLVVAPFLSRRSRSILEQAGVSYLDLTGNTRITADYPGLFIRTNGADRDPTPRHRPERGISGPAAGRVIRALTDFYPPYSVKALAALASVDPGACSRTLQVLEREAFVKRDKSKAVQEVEWSPMLRRRGGAVSLFDRGRTKAYIARPGTDNILQALTQLLPDQYAVTGSFAAVRLRAVTAPTGLTVYANSVDALAEQLDLMPADQGANVRLIRPATEGVFARSNIEDGIRWVAPSQIVLDCLGGTGRMPQEGEAVLEWMIENEARWRQATPARATA